MSCFVSKKGRTLVSGQAVDNSLRCLIIDHIVANGGDLLTGYFPGSMSAVGNHFKLSQSFVSKLWKKCCKEGSISPQRRGCNNPPHLQNQDLEFIEALKSAKPSMPYSKILEAVDAHCNIPSGTSVSAISRAVQSRLNGEKWTFKRMASFKCEKFHPDNVDYCQDFLNYIHGVDPYKLKFFDESGFALHSGVGKPNYGHSPVNTTCVEIGKFLTSPNITLNMLIGMEGLLYANTENGASDAMTFLNFFGEASNNLMPNGEPILQYGDHVILDNCPIHHNEAGYALGEWLDSIGVEVVYLPTYSPELNPIELAFNKLKKIAVREEIREVFARSVHDGIYACLEEITVDDCVGFIKHAQYINV